MKLVAVLISLMVIFLNAIPCCWDSCTEDINMEHMESGTDAEDLCSPFLSCGSCTGFIMQEDLLQLNAGVKPFRVLNEHQQHHITFEFTTRIWQPPRQV